MSRVEKILIALINGTSYDGPLLSRVEEILYSFLVDSTYDKPGESRVEDLLLALKNSSLYSDSVISRIEEILYCKLGNVEYTGPIGSRVEALLVQWELTKIIVITGVPPFTFNAKGTPLLDYTIYGNTIQSGTPTPDSPIEPEFCGDLVSIELDEPLRAVGDYKDTLDLETGTLTRRIAKIELDKLSWTLAQGQNYRGFRTSYSNQLVEGAGGFSNSLSPIYGTSVVSQMTDKSITFYNYLGQSIYIRFDEAEDTNELLSAIQGATLYAVLAEPIVTTISSIPDGLTGVIEGTVTQSGTPTPDNPIEPVFKGDLQPNGKYQVYKTYKIPISSAGQTKTIYLGQTPTTRRIKKLVLTGEETNWELYGKSLLGHFLSSPPYAKPLLTDGTKTTFLSTILPGVDNKGYGAIYSGGFEGVYTFIASSGGRTPLCITDYDKFSSVSDIQNFLAAQYAAGTPVTVWYVLATPEVGVVNEPLCRIGDYADSVDFSQAGVEIPTTAGTNTLSVGTTVQPSNMSIEVEEGYVPKKPVYITSDDKLYITSNEEVYILRR